VATEMAQHGASHHSDRYFLLNSGFNPGWQFGIAEFIDGPIMIVLLMLTFRPTINTRQKEVAVIQAQLTCKAESGPSGC
jgi:hypothetical protein